MGLCLCRSDSLVETGGRHGAMSALVQSIGSQRRWRAPRTRDILRPNLRCISGGGRPIRLWR